MDPELFEESFYALYQRFGASCLKCLRLQPTVNVREPGEPFVVQDCVYGNCGFSVEEQEKYWSVFYNHFYVWDPEADYRHLHQRFAPGSPDTWLQVVPCQYVLLFSKDQVINTLIDRSEYLIREICFSHVQTWLNNIMEEEDEKNDFSEFYFKALNLSKSLHIVLSEGFVRRLELPELPSPYLHRLHELTEEQISQVNRTCVICTKPLRKKERLFVFPACKHVFHSKCTMQWFDARMEERTCPLCRGILFEK